MHNIKKVFRIYSSCVKIPALLWIFVFHIAVCDIKNFSSRVLFTEMFTIHWSFVLCGMYLSLQPDICVSLFNDVVQPDKNKGKNAAVNKWMWIDHYVTSYIFHLICSFQDTTNKVFRFILKVYLIAYLVMTFRNLYLTLDICCY